jgi:PAS domain S-box-containing protein
MQAEHDLVLFGQSSQNPSRVWLDEDLWSGVFDALDQPLCLFDREGHVLRCNRAAVSWWGAAPMPSDRWCAGRAVFRDGAPISHEDLPPARAIALDRRVEESGLELLRQDGSRSRYDVRAAPVRNPDGAVVGAIACVRDLVDRSDLETARGRLAAIIQTSDDAIISTDLQGRITSWNEGARRLYGYTADEMIGRPTSVLIPSASQDEQPDVLARIRSGGTLDHYETFRRRNDGTLVAVSLTVSPMLDERGTVIGASKIARDVSERHAAELVKNRLAAIVESSDDAIISKDLKGIITSWNRGAERLFGYSEKEVIGKPITILIPPERLDEEPQVLGRIARGESLEHFETVRRHKNGQLLDISLTVSPIRTRHGVIVGASKIARDITERKRAERRLAEADRRKDEFLAMLSHELRNPLAPLRTSLDVLAERPTAEAARLRVIDIMRRQVDHLVRLVDDLLEVSRISRGTITLVPDRHDLSEILHDALEISRPLLQSRQHQLSLAMAPSAVGVMADRVRLVQVFSNVLNNAAKFTPPGGSIQVLLETRGADAVVRIIDTGIGIPQADLETVFEMFTQLGHGDAAASGLGVGLSLVHRLIDMHGGRVEAISRGLGHGTEIRIVLPLIHSEATAPPAQPDATSPAHALGLRILIVDDNQDAADAMAALLGSLGFEAHVAYNGSEAIDCGDRLHPDVLLLDIGLPGMSGYDVATVARQREWGRRALFVALTGWGQEDDRARSRAAGFDHHLVKPVTTDALLHALRSASPASSLALG